MGRALAVIAVLAGLAAGGWHFRHEIEAWVRSMIGGGQVITPIAEIVAAPQRFDGREVTVTGTVSGTSEVSFGGAPPTRTYTLRDGRAEIVVDTRAALPPRGQSLRVTGKAARPPGAGLATRLSEARREAAK
jgi:hypothetical protein